MQEIEYKGGNSVKITTKTSTLLVDPNVQLLGLKNPKLSADDVQIATDTRFAIPANDTRSFEGPGEYEVGPFSIRGVAAWRMIDTPEEQPQSTMYRVEVGDIRIGIIGNVAAQLSEEQLESLGIIDLLIVPIGGGGYTLDATDAIKLIRQIEPSIVVPVHYAETGVTYEVPQETSERFEAELSAEVERLPKLKLKGASSLPASLKVYHLERQ